MGSMITRVLGLHERFMTRAQWKEFKSSAAYAKFRLMEQGKTKELWDLEMREMTQARDEAWTIALEMAESIVLGEAKDVPFPIQSETLAKLKETLAEKLLLEQHLVPPTYTHTIECEQCGPSLSKTPSLNPVKCCVFCIPAGAL